MTEYLGRQFHRQSVGKVVDAEKEKEPALAWMSNKSQPENLNKKKEEKKSKDAEQRPPTKNYDPRSAKHEREAKEYMEKHGGELHPEKDAEPVASGEYSADADLIPIDDKALS